MFEWHQVAMFVCQLAVLAFFIRRDMARGERRIQFSLRCLFGLMTIAAVVLGIFQLPLHPIVKAPLCTAFLFFSLWILAAIEDGLR